VDSSETEIDKHLRRYPDLLTVILHIFHTGYQDMQAIPQAKLIKSITGVVKGLTPDWLLSGRNSDGYSWWLVELKGPKEAIFAKRNNRIVLAGKTNEGISQLMMYRDFCDKNQTFFRDTFKMEGFTAPKGILIIGRERDLSVEMQELKRVWNDTNEKLQIRTWDAIIRALCDKWAFIDGERISKRC
jgi:hypothetical protein